MLAQSDHHGFIGESSRAQSGEEHGMSKDAVAEFLLKVDRDEALRKELATALEGGSEQGKVMSEAASRLGLEFTPDEYTEVLAEVNPQEDGALSEAELEAVAGGTMGSSVALPAVQAAHPLQNIRMKGGLAFIS